MSERAASAPSADGPRTVAGDGTRAISPRAAALHDDALVWDMVFVFEPDHGTDLMLRRGYTDEDVRGILGGNWLRVCRQVWKEPK